MKLHMPPVAQSQRPMWKAACAFLLLLLQPAQCQQDSGPPGAPDATHYRFRIGHSVVVAGNNLYIDGGEVASGEHADKSAQSVISNKTAIIRIDQKWETKEPAISVIDVGESGLRVTETALWRSEDGQAVYGWGGSVGTRGQEAQDSHLRVLQNTWANDSTIPTLSSSNSGGGNGKIARTRSGSWTTCNGLGFLLGGATPFSQETTEFAPVPGLVTFDTRSKAWDNVSAEAFSPATGALGGTHLGGAAVCLPTFGTNDAGLVVFLGGKAATGLGVGASWVDVPFETIYFYDIGTRKFHSQFATQDSKDALPAPRTEFCAAVTRPSSNSSYEIVVFGGRNGLAMADVHILTVPGFRWYKVSDAESARYQHGCAVVGSGRRQMLSVGGIESWEEKFSSGISDPWKSGLKVFDMTTLKWSDSYDPAAAAYETPANIKSWYDAGGRESVKWDSSITKSLFTIATSTQPTDSHTGNGVSDMSNTSSATPVGAIVGGVIGGVAVLLMAVGLFFFMRRRCRRNADHKLSKETLEEQYGSEHKTTQTPSTIPSPASSELSDHSSKHAWSPKPAFGAAAYANASEMPGQALPGWVHELQANDVPREMHNTEISPAQELSKDQTTHRSGREQSTLDGFASGR